MEPHRRIPATPSARTPIRRLTLAVVVAAAALVGGGAGASITSGGSADTGCWDEYNLAGTRLARTIAPKGVQLRDCTPAVGCYDSYQVGNKKIVRRLVPHDADPATACAPPIVPPVTAPPTVPPITAPPSSGFSEDFSGNTGLERFRTGIYHRDEFVMAETQWQGDHDLNCGPPGTTRTIHRDDPDASFYLCRDHLMTAVGDTAGYSTAFFAPDRTFTDITSVSWSVNVTDLGGRQWWEVAVLGADDPDLVAIDWLAPDPSGLAPYPADAVVFGNGPFGGDLRLTAGGTTVNPTGFLGLCDLDPVGCASKPIRRSFTLTDNGDGTVSLDMFGETYTVAGSFPAGEVKVVFKDHNYTPDKDGVPVGYTWHWDDIVVF